MQKLIIAWEEKYSLISCSCLCVEGPVKSVLHSLTDYVQINQPDCIVILIVYLFVYSVEINLYYSFC